MMPIVLLLSEDVRCEDNLARMLRDSATLKRRPLESRTHGSTVDYRAVILDVRSASATDRTRLVVSVTSRFEDVPVVVYPSASPIVNHKYWPIQLAATSTRKVGVLLERDSAAGEWSRAFCVAETPLAWGAISAAISGRLPATVSELLEYSVEGACATVTVDELAARRGEHARTLQVQLRKESVPSPNTFIECGRALYSAWALHRDKRTVDELARCMGLSLTQTLRDEVERQLGTRLRELREAGAFEMAVELVIARLFRRE
ncbi:MAG: hypothetical protein ABJC26_05040 [Gemmatimonadaceae bacterium]